MRLAILADIHGNLPALDAVITELERLQPDYVVLDGDLINAAPFSSEVIARVREFDWIVIRGNHEFYYLDFDTERAPPGGEDPLRWGQLHWLVKRMTKADGEYLAMLPDERTFYVPGTQPLRIAHGVPGQNRVGFYPRQHDEEIAEKIGHVMERTLISAHTHVQIDRQIDVQTATGNRTCHVINPGSVGLPLNGNPHAQFAILQSVTEEVEVGGWQVTHYGIDYDRRPVLEAFIQSGMLEAGGVMSQLFYWQICTASSEVIPFFRWSWENGYDPDCNIAEAFQAYVAATSRDRYVQAHDPLA